MISGIACVTLAVVLLQESVLSLSFFVELLTYSLIDVMVVGVLSSLEN